MSKTISFGKYVHNELCTPNESNIYIQSDMIALTSEYHLHARNSLLTEINRCRVGQKRHIKRRIKTAFLFSLWPHMHLNIIALTSVYHFHSRN